MNGFITNVLKEKRRIREICAYDWIIDSPSMLQLGLSSLCRQAGEALAMWTRKVTKLNMPNGMEGEHSCRNQIEKARFHQERN